jgi:outer membrane protein OmpA-like peptidoglycan-associated protein
MTTEDLLLRAEASLGKVAGELDVVPMFDEGYGPTTEAVLRKIDDLDQDRNQLDAKVADCEETSKGMQEQIASLESELGGVSEEREAMQARMDAEAKVRAQFAQVESLFTRQEAQVYRQGNTVLIRMVGLNFDVGKATINSQNFPLLTKVQNAIKIFPGSNVQIEGYTDSYGSDDTNQVLSQQRADAVREYLLANMGLSPASIQATGYGESNPIASNETPEGRLKNRRIDLTIQPNLAGEALGAIAD